MKDLKVFQRTRKVGVVFGERSAQSRSKSFGEGQDLSRTKETIIRELVRSLGIVQVRAVKHGNVKIQTARVVIFIVILKPSLRSIKHHVKHYVSGLRQRIFSAGIALKRSITVPNSF